MQSMETSKHSKETCSRNQRRHVHAVKEDKNFTFFLSEISGVVATDKA